MVAAGLQRNVYCGAGGILPAVCKGIPLGMELAEPGMISLTDHFAVLDDHRANQWVWLSVSGAFPCQ